MIEKVNINPTAFKSYSYISNSISNPIDNRPREFNSNFYVDKAGAEAIKVKNFVENPTEIRKPISYEDYIKQLKNANLVENKDYILNEYDNTNGSKDYSVTIMRNGNNEKPYKIVFWNNGKNLENYNGYQDNVYPIKNNQPNTIIFGYDAKGYLERKISQYENPDMHKDLFPENIDINTTSQEYINILKQKNIKYDVNTNTLEDDGTITSIHELNDEGKEIKAITFFEYKNGNKSIFYNDTPGIDGVLTRSIDLVKDDNYYGLYVTEDEKYKGNMTKNAIKY